jgi:CRP-like cAMP-binding protein
VQALDTLRALAGAQDRRTFSAGETIFRAGDPGKSMYGLLEGSVRLSWNGEAGHEDLHAGDVFGAGALVVPEHTRFGNAVASSDCVLVEINREKFLFAVQETPMFAVALLASIDERLRALKRSMTAAD